MISNSMIKLKGIWYKGIMVYWSEPNTLYHYILIPHAGQRNNKQIDFNILIQEL